MGFYLKKAIPFGPLRLNLSKSGLGVSAGVTGFRVGVGPRGSYVHAGRGGLYFRQSLSPPARLETRNEGARAPQAGIAPIEIESGSALEMVDSSAADLLEELNRKCQVPRLQPVAWVLAMLLVLVAWAAGVLVLTAVAAAMAVVLILSAGALDRARKTTIIDYELEPAAQAAYEQLCAVFMQLQSCGRVWHVQTKAGVEQRKYHAGAGTVVTRTPIQPGSTPISFVRVNLPTPTIPVGRQTLAFMPDRLLVFERQAVGAVPYEELAVTVAEQRMIEHGALPPDAEVVGRTWQYVNRDGGPDRRFASNPELPIARYEQIHFASRSGLNEVVHLSRPGIGAQLQQAVALLATTP